MDQFLYDVALSFAGEDRKFVKDVAEQLRNKSVKVFYDEYETANLWGKDLLDYLEDVYRVKSQYVIIFVSQHYLEKPWTNFERRSALNRAMQNKAEYILPIKLDDTILPGLFESTSYLSYSQYNAAEICDLFVEKIKKKIPPLNHH